MQSLFHNCFLLCQSPMLNEHSGAMAKCEQMSEWIHWVLACIGIAVGWVTMGKSLLAFLRLSRKVQFSLYELYTSFQAARSMWLLTSHRSFHLSHVLLLVAISGITCAQPTMFFTLNTCKGMAAGSSLPCPTFDTGIKLIKIFGIVVSARANQYSTKTPSSFWSFIFNSCCRCHRRLPFIAP
jgi:hypothetical protein